MNKLALLFCASSALNAFSQENFTTSGNKILDPCGNEFIMKGVNYSVSDDWNFPGNLNTGKELSAQIIQANPNTVRVQWYVDYGQPTRPALTLASLDSVISRFKRADIVTVLELHDYTHIHTDTTGFNDAIVAWWTSAPVVELIEKHRKNLIVNIANEYGPTKWIGINENPNYAAEIVTWRKHYKSVINTLRIAGIKVPLMIDAPQYGMDVETVLAVASEFHAIDPLHNIIMSCHAYWPESIANVTSKIFDLSLLDVPVVLGEVGNVDATCSDLELSSLLQVCKDKGIGWMAWTWNRDGDCAQRNMTKNDDDWNAVDDGMFSTLTTYGDLIVNNAQFGLANHAIKADMSCEVGLEKLAIVKAVYPNPLGDKLNIDFEGNVMLDAITIFNLNGQICGNYELNVSTSRLSLNVEQLENGFYYVKVTTDGGQFELVKVVKK